MATINKTFISNEINGIKINTSKKCHSSNYSSSLSRNVKYIVLHYTGNKKDTAIANANYFQRANIKASAHFFVDDESIYQSVGLRNAAWHCGTSGKYYSNCRNSTSLGIEMCCTADNYLISDKTIENAAYLTAHLCKLLGITAKQVDTYVLRHYDVTHKKCPAQMANSADDKDWIAFKNRVKSILNGTDKPVFKTYKVKITADALNVRTGPGVNNPVVTTVKKNYIFTIIDEKDGWGFLKSEVGWIKLSYTKRV